MCMPIIAGLVSGVGAAMSASAQAASAKAQGEFENRQAGIETATGAYKAERTQDEINRTLGQQRAGFAASGLSLEGSPGDVIAETAEEGALDVAAIRWNSKLSSDNLRYKAKISDMNAKQAKTSIPFAFLSPTLNGIASYQSSFA